LLEQPFGVPGTTNWNRNNGWVLDVAVDPVHSNVVYSAADAGSQEQRRRPQLDRRRL